MTIVLLGGTGFVGSAVLRRLALRAAPDVRMLVRAQVTATAPAFATLVQGDLRSLPQGLLPARPFVVIHLATKQVDHDGTGFDAVNVRATEALMERLGPACRGVVYSSSLSVYGPGAQCGEDEDAPLAPATPLTRSRVAAESVIRRAGEANGQSAIILRPRFILGQGDAFTLPGLHRLFAQGLSVASGQQAFTVIDVDDYAEVIVRLALDALESRMPEQATYHVGYTRPVTLGELRAAIATRFPLPRTRLCLPAPARVLRMAAAIPSPSLRGLVTKLELIGLSHHVSVARLSSRLGDDLLERDPRDVARAAARHLGEGRAV